MLITAMYVVKEQSERYEPVETLSEGAMGTVVLARDRERDRFVAVKTVKLEGVENPEERQRLQEALRSEAQVIQLLSHPNIVAVHEVLDEHGSTTPSLVMEYVPGSTLEAYLKGGNPLPLDFVLSVSLQVSRALEHAHAMGVVHGDIKPSNILISDDGEQAKIADFGIARLVNEGSDSRPGLFGTPRYISPEQLLGQKADQRSDLFSFGVVLYEMLSGRSPFAGNNAREITQEIARGGADLSTQALRDVPTPLQEVLRRALARDPGERFQSARQMAQMIEHPEPLEAPADTVATQDLSALVVPEIPDLDSVAAPDPVEEPAHLTSPVIEDVDPESPPVATHYSVTEEPHRWQRWVLIGLLAAIPTLAIGLTAVWFATPASPPDGRFSEQHILTAEVLPLLKEGRRQMLEGQTEVAIRLFRRAQSLAPASSDLTRALHEAEREAIDQQENQRQSAEIDALLTSSRAALDSGRTQRAARQATQALSLDPDNPEAQALLDAAGSVRPQKSATARPRKSSPPPQTTAKSQTPPVIQPTGTRSSLSTPSAPVRSSPPPRPTPRAPVTQGPVSTSANLRVDVFSYLSKGVLTVYAGQDQVLLQPFRFVQKSGFMRKKKTAGRLETSVVLPSGPTEFRIYVSADGQETQTVNLEADLAGDETHVLRLIIAENGSASAQLN